MTSNNRYVPSIQSQLQYLAEWFQEFSDMQKADFLPILVQKFGNKGYVNGLLPEMENVSNLEYRPPSLFQCRILLFLEWTESWGLEEKQLLLTRFKNVDPSFSDKYEKEVRACSQEELSN